MEQVQPVIRSLQEKFVLLIDYQVKGLNWRRDTRLRVMEHLCGVDYGNLKSSNDLNPADIETAMNVLFPNNATEYYPPIKTQKQLRVLCEYYSKRVIAEKGLPSTLVGGHHE